MIKVQNVSKSFGNLKAVDNISFQIAKGEVFGLLGPNGAGKSTTINILSTLLSEDSGEIIVDGLNLKENKDVSKLIIGVVPQEVALYKDLSAFDNLMFWGGLYKIPKAELRRKANEVLALVGLEDRKNDPLKNYSGGMKRRVNIAASILHDPKILLMDEPTVGIDPQSRSYIFEIIEQLKDNGMTIIYTTHYMEEAERLCDTIAIIDTGSIKAIGTMKELRKVSDTNDSLSIKVSHLNEEIISHLQKTLKLVGDLNTMVLDIECENISQEITGVLKDIQDTGVIIESIDTQRANLESVFLKLTGKHLRD
jgi:ABC-2 type transport system ATP-binding protein